jgi:hypothetical protein
LEQLILKGHLVFQDYAISKWFLHIYSITEPDNIRVLFSGAGDSGTALRNLGQALKDFTLQYPDIRVENSTAHEETLQRCQAFISRDFYDPLFLVVSHTLHQQKRGFVARNEVSIPSLKDVLQRNREVVEKFAAPGMISEDFINMYGHKRFKCSMLTCYCFHEGFDNVRDRDHHIKRHTRPFLCPEATCTTSEFGFVSNNELDKHRRVYHPDIGDKLYIFEDSNVVATSRNKCDICGQKFTRPLALREHTLAHFGQRPHPCSTCGKAFTRKNDCTRHEKIHSRR